MKLEEFNDVHYCALQLEFYNATLQHTRDAHGIHVGLVKTPARKKRIVQAQGKCLVKFRGWELFES
jgi:hypothetical protein